MEDFSTHPILKKVLEDTVKMTVDAFKFAVKRENLVLSEDLLNSIRAGAIEPSKDFITGNIYYSELLRIKDIKQLHYTSIPPLGAIVEWVEKIGPDKFPYVPGYPEGVTPTSYTATVYRIAEGVRWNLKSHPNVKRGYRSVHNDPLKNNILPHFYLTMRDFALRYTQSTVYNEFGVTPVNIFQDFQTGVNPSRLQAGWNSRDTKLARKYAIKTQF